MVSVSDAFAACMHLLICAPSFCCKKYYKSKVVDENKDLLDILQSSVPFIYWHCKSCGNRRTSLYLNSYFV